MTRHASSIAIAFAAASLVACSDADSAMDSAELSESDRVDSASRAELAISEAILDGSMIEAAMAAASEQALPDSCGTISFDLHTVRRIQRAHLSGSVELQPESCAAGIRDGAPEHGAWRMSIQIEVEAGAAAAAIVADATCLMPPQGELSCGYGPGSFASVDTDRYVELDLSDRRFSARSPLDDHMAGAAEPGPASLDRSDACFVTIDDEGQVGQVCLD